MTTEKDIYDQEVERLTNEPYLIENSWQNAAPLFRFAGSAMFCGCLTQIRRGQNIGIHPDVDAQLEKEIRADERIPKETSDITVESLPVFAEWQRKLDVYREKYKSE